MLDLGLYTVDGVFYLWYYVVLWPPSPPSNFAAQTEICHLNALCWHTPSLTSVVTSYPNAD